MRKVVAAEFLSLDGVMESPDQWHFPYFNDEMGQAVGEGFETSDALLMGRILYEEWAAFWPNQNPEENPVATTMNDLTKYVVSTTLEEPLEWNNSRLLQGDVPNAVASLKDARSGEIQVHGSCGLVQTLIEHDLVDEYRLWTFPVLLGTGKRLFDGGTIPAGLELIASTTSSTGVVITRYRRAGDISFGTFEVDERGGVEALWTEGDKL